MAAVHSQNTPFLASLPLKGQYAQQTTTVEHVHEEGGPWDQGLSSQDTRGDHEERVTTDVREPRSLSDDPQMAE